jgi:cell wall-associated NlpC family hydrolase
MTRKEFLLLLFPKIGAKRVTLTFPIRRCSSVLVTIAAAAAAIYAPLSAAPVQPGSPIAAPASTPAAPHVAQALASGYTHFAAVRMAANVNTIRRTVSVKHMSRHDIRLLRHDKRVAARAANVAAKRVRVAMQDKALHSGNVVVAANSFRGSRYVMGGTSRSGFDCSGFVRYILSNTSGVEIPRTASEQYWHGQPIEAKDMQPGDLVFFKNTYKHGISHVGLYEGNGKFVHAANSHKGVREDSLNTPYYANHFAGARRVLPQDMRRISAGH